MAHRKSRIFFTLSVILFQNECASSNTKKDGFIIETEHFDVIGGDDCRTGARLLVSCVI